MEHDEITRYLASLAREDSYRVDATLKESPHELTQRVFLMGAEGSRRGPYVRKLICRESGMGAAYERIFEAQQSGTRFAHIPRLHECYLHDNVLVVVMEHVDGETLQDAVYRRDPSLSLALDVFPDVCDAVSELHETFEPPLIHRDLKPSNVMVSPDSLFIIDFGIARDFKEGAGSDTVKFGTRAFAPPEQFGFGQTTVRSDVYALGMVLYFCLTEEIPTAQVRDARFEVAGVPAFLRPVLVRATAFDPDERYASAAALKRAFLTACRPEEAFRESGSAPHDYGASAADAGRGIGAGAAARAATSTEPRTRRRILATAAACACVAAIVAGGALAFHGASGNGEGVEAGGNASSSASGNASSSASSSTDGDAATSAHAASAEGADAQELVSDMRTGAPKRDGFDPETNVAVEIAGVTFQIPSYFTARVESNEGGGTYYYAESGSSLGMVMTSESDVPLDDAFDVSHVEDEFLTGLISSNETLFAEVTSSIDCELAGCAARIVTLRGTVKDLPTTTKATYFVNEDREAGKAAIGSIFLGQTDNAQFDYSEDFAKTLATATR